MVKGCKGLRRSSPGVVPLATRGGSSSVAPWLRLPCPVSHLVRCRQVSDTEVLRRYGYTIHSLHHLDQLKIHS